MFHKLMTIKQYLIRGGLNMDYPTTVGKANERGELLGELCTRNNLIVTNKQFQKRKI